MITLLLGGARSGKSELAEELAAKAGTPVTYVATAAVGDDDFAVRVAAHVARRPAGWNTVECGDDLPGALRAAAGTVLVDSLGTWLARFRDFEVAADAVCEALRTRNGDTVIVSEEVGLGVHPETDVGRAFRDALGALNRAVASVADDVLLVVAGRVLRLEEA